MSRKISIMGILNCTPDSFYDGGRYPDLKARIDRALEMADEGADWLDIGGESTRPGSSGISCEEERERVIPLIKALKSRSTVKISCDTTKADIAREALDCGASMINDVSGMMRDPQMACVVRRAGADVVIMHARGEPAVMQEMTDYSDVVEEVAAELRGMVQRALQAGIAPAKIYIDPGFGFSKNAAQNRLLLKRLDTFREWGYPLVVGLSRKSFIGQWTGREDSRDRLAGSLAAAFIAAVKGAEILRVHDVKETRDMLHVMETVL